MYDVMATPRLRGRRTARRANGDGEGDWSPARHRAITGDEVVLSTLDPHKPATLRPTEGNDYLYLLMPVRVS